MDVILPSSVTEIGDNAFYGCDNITSINIHENITKIGDFAFQGCSGHMILNINVPNDIEEPNVTFNQIIEKCYHQFESE